MSIEWMTFRSRASAFLGRYHRFFRVLALVVYAWLIICAVSYGITQSSSINAYGIQAGTPLPIAIAIAPAASIWYLAQFITYGSIHTCGTFTHPSAWPQTWPGDRVEQNVNTFDDVWFSLIALAFVTLLLSTRSFFTALRAVSVAPILLGIILFFDDNYWFYVGFSDELNRSGAAWLTNENIMFAGAGCFIASTLYLRLRRHGPSPIPPS
jgi:hypothetical protein